MVADSAQKNSGPGAEGEEERETPTLSRAILYKDQLRS
jgi:hypothetical protein